MSTTTYNFTTVTVPAGATSHKGTSGSGSLPAPPSGTEGTQANIDNIESSNAVYWSNSPGGTPWKMFRWYDPTALPVGDPLTPTEHSICETMLKEQDSLRVLLAALDGDDDSAISTASAGITPALLALLDEHQRDRCPHEDNVGCQRPAVHFHHLLCPLRRYRTSNEVGARC